MEKHVSFYIHIIQTPCNNVWYGISTAVPYINKTHLQSGEKCWKQSSSHLTTFTSRQSTLEPPWSPTTRPLHTFTLWQEVRKCKRQSEELPSSGNQADSWSQRTTVTSITLHFIAHITLTLIFLQTSIHPSIIWHFHKTSHTIMFCCILRNNKHLK